MMSGTWCSFCFVDCGGAGSKKKKNAGSASLVFSTWILNCGRITMMSTASHCQRARCWKVSSVRTFIGVCVARLLSAVASEQRCCNVT